MGWNLRRSRKIAPGIRLNLSNKGLGVSAGPRHSKISISPGKRITTNIGIPGTGIRYTNVVSPNKRKQKNATKNSSSLTETSHSTYGLKPKKLKGPVPAWGVVWILSSLAFLIQVFSKTNPFGDPNLPTPNTAQSRLTALLGTVFWGYIAFRSFRKRKRSNALWLEQESGYQLSGEPIPNTVHKSQQVTPSLPSLSSHESNVDEYKSNFINSRFNRAPRTKSEWVKTKADYAELASLAIKVGNFESDKSAAVEFPVRENEVVFIRSKAFLTDSSDENLDAGLVYVTNQRVSFLGGKQTCEWIFSNMTIFLPFDEKAVVLFQNTDHSLVQGVHIINDDFFKFQMFLTTAYSFSKYPISEIVHQIVEASAKYQTVEPGNSSS